MRNLRNTRRAVEVEHPGYADGFGVRTGTTWRLVVTLASVDGDAIEAHRCASEYAYEFGGSVVPFRWQHGRAAA